MIVVVTVVMMVGVLEVAIEVMEDVVKQVRRRWDAIVGMNDCHGDGG